MQENSFKELMDYVAGNIANTRLSETINATRGLPAIVIPEGYSVYNVEHLLPNPNHFVAEFTTNILGEFIDYSNANVSDSCRIFVNPESMSALAIFDMGDYADPEWGKHKAALSLVKNIEFSALSQAANDVISQDAFINFLEDFGDCIELIGGDGNKLEFTKALPALRKLTVESISTSEHNEGEFKKTHSKFDQIEISSKGNQLPVALNFTCAPYEGLELKKISCQLRYQSSGQSPVIRLRINKLPIIQRELGQEFKAYLISKIDRITDDVRVYTGNMRYRGA